MKHKISILYSWIVRISTLILPNIPVFMRFRGFLYSALMRKCGRNFQVASTTIINSLSTLEVGDNVYIAHNTVVIGKEITLESDVLIGPNCVISSGNHSFENGSYRFGKHFTKPVLIERGSWIGGNCSILAGSWFPARSILAAGAVLNKRFTDTDSLYVGIPARRVKSLNH